MGSGLITMVIRTALVSDAIVLADLLDQLGYPDTTEYLPAKIAKMAGSPDEELLVYEKDGRVVALISFHFIPQIALRGDFARISYFSVADDCRSQGIGHEVLEHCTGLAKARGCDRIEVHSHSRRADAHRFYLREGFEESPKYFIRKLASR